MVFLTLWTTICKLYVVAPVCVFVSRTLSFVITIIPFLIFPFTAAKWSNRRTRWRIFAGSRPGQCLLLRISWQCCWWKSCRIGHLSCTLRLLFKKVAGLFHLRPFFVHVKCNQALVVLCLCVGVSWQQCTSLVATLLSIKQYYCSYGAVLTGELNKHTYTSSCQMLL